MSSSISIGLLSKLTGISVERIRIWENRYQFPQAERLESGHRRYSYLDVIKIRILKELLSFGLRIGKVINLRIGELENLLIENHPKSKLAIPNYQTIAEVIDSLKMFEEDKLSDFLRSSYQDYGPLYFVLRCIEPLMEQIGLAWLSGELTIAQEHFASAKIGDYLASCWRVINETNEGPVAILSSIPKDMHRMGLSMSALILVNVGFKVLFIGSDTPSEEIINTTKDYDISLVCLSVSITISADEAKSFLEEIREDISTDIPIVVGGQGSPENVEGIDYFEDFIEFHEWLKTLHNRINN